MKCFVLLFTMTLCMCSFNVMAKVNGGGSTAEVLKKHYSGKPGYNRRAMKSYKKSFNTRLVLAQAAEAGKSIKAGNNMSRQKLMKYRRHP